MALFLAWLLKTALVAGVVAKAWKVGSDKVDDKRNGNQWKRGKESETSQDPAVENFLSIANSGAVYKGVHRSLTHLVAVIVKDNFTEQCAVLKGTAQVEEAQKKVLVDVKQVKSKELQTYLDYCQKLHPSMGEILVGNGLSWGIYPGTKWCGDGNIASSRSDLGEAAETDKCCRAHDFNARPIPPRGSRHGLINYRHYPMIQCEVDEQLYECLTAEGSPASLVVGHEYFDVLAPICYTETHPYECKRYHPGTKVLCVEYVLNQRKPKRWQKLYNPRFTNDYRDL
ncbi:uncharacterized protein LOC135397555 [Ornithodoros turicata]|uniref:uncharacterized protein LOC135397555 n=1 Tax=Ornithodoros turicata TaxID=34597 RepID=UPI00313A2E10